MEFLIYMCNWGLRRRAPLPAGKIGTPTLRQLPCRPLKHLSAKIADGKFLVEASSILFMKRKPLPNPFVQLFKIIPFQDGFLKNTSELHWFSFRKMSNELRCFKCQSNAMAPYTPFLSIEVDIVCPLSSFFHSVLPSVGLAGTKERSNLCNSLA